MFRGAFQAPMQRPFSQEGGAVPWYLAGGIAKANCIAAYQPKGAASLVASYVNLANPGTYNAAPGTAPTWDVVNGWGFDGSTKYLLSGVTPANDQSYSAVVRFSNRANDGSVYGSGNSAYRFWIVPQFIAYASGGSSTVAPGLDAGVLGVAGNHGYRNGTQEATISSNPAVASDVAIGARKTGATISSYFSGNIQAFAIYGSVLTDVQMLALAVAMAAL